MQYMFFNQHIEKTEAPP